MTLPPFIRLEPVTTCAHRRVFHSCVNALVPAYTVLSYLSLCVCLSAHSPHASARSTSGPTTGLSSTTRSGSVFQSIRSTTSRNVLGLGARVEEV